MLVHRYMSMFAFLVRFMLGLYTWESTLPTLRWLGSYHELTLLSRLQHHLCAVKQLILLHSTTHQHHYTGSILIQFWWASEAQNCMKSWTFGNELAGGIPNPNIASPLSSVVLRFAYGNISEQGSKLMLGSSKWTRADLHSCHSTLGKPKGMQFQFLLPAWLLHYMKESSISRTCWSIAGFYI